MFLFELLIYVFFAWVMYRLAVRSENYQIEMSDDGMANYKLDKYLWYYMLFFAVISAIRWRVGVDSLSYIKIFTEGEVRDDSKEFLWDALVNFVHDWGLHFTVGTGLAAFFQIFCLTESLKKYRYILIFLPIVLFGGRYYLDLMNGVRQMMVACGFVFISKYIVERKPLLFVIGVLMLSGIHHSALILLPTYLLTYVPFSKINLSDRRFLSLALLFICFVVGQTPAFEGLIKYIQPIVMSSGYEKYSDFYASLLSGESKEALSMGPIMISYLLSSAAVIWFAPALKKEFENEIECFNLWYFFSFLFSCWYFLVCNAGYMMIRPAQYFEFFLVIMLTLLVYQFYKNGQRNLLYCLVFLIWTCTLAGIYKSIGKPYESTTYKTYFDHLK